MDDTLIRPARPPRTTDRGVVVAGFALLLFLSLAAVASPVLASPERVDEVTLVNRSEWLVQVEVRVGDGWSTIGLAPAGSRTVIADVLDGGPTWRLRFRVADATIESSTDRSRLAAADWRIEVPDTIADAATDAGVGPAPPRS